jgi:hypothetical protein
MPEALAVGIACRTPVVAGAVETRSVAVIFPGTAAREAAVA